MFLSIFADLLHFQVLSVFSLWSLQNSSSVVELFLENVRWWRLCAKQRNYGWRANVLWWMLIYFECFPAINLGSVNSLLSQTYFQYKIIVSLTAVVTFIILNSSTDRKTEIDETQQEKNCWKKRTHGNIKLTRWFSLTNSSHSIRCCL